MKELHVSNHPLIQHKLALMRSVDTEPKKFREVVREITTLLLYEATQDLETVEIEVQTPMAATKGQKIALRIGFVPIHIAAVDSHLNEHGYIVPGLGDAGDRQFGTS